MSEQTEVIDLRTTEDYCYSQKAAPVMCPIQFLAIFLSRIYILLHTKEAKRIRLSL